ncbi:CoA transferase subunit A [Vibrio maerlii]|uniref:CoA transferase subunit A n=1 Tax=Vibrio maerlii TaxID=2231648 RepID=UPI000E3C24B3|nr:3-oxoacid CoA-transferase subunit A [Vibrio maerlii]
MLLKTVLSPQQAVAKIEDGMTLMVGGFMTIGSPEKVIDAIVESGVKNLTIICNDAGLPGKGVGKLIESGQVSKLVASHIGLNRAAGDKMNSGEMEVELVPQGTLVEQIRAAGAGLGGVLTKTGVGTLVQEGKRVIEINDEEFLLELPRKADVSLLKASTCDVFGNTFYNKTTKNFNPVMATAAEMVLVEPDEVVDAGVYPVDAFTTPSVLIDYIVE